MKYGEEFVKKVVDSVLSGRCSQRGVENILGVPRKTVGKWVRRAIAGLPARFKRSAKTVRQIPEELSNKLRSLLSNGKSSVVAWANTGKQCALRTVQRKKARWFPKPARVKRKFKRYERRKALSLGHTDWGSKRILGGKRMCFTFHVDDATRTLYALKAYSNANQINTADALFNATEETGGFKSALSDCGKVYTIAWGELCQNVGTKPIHTRPYNPQCNGKAEAVVKKVKNFLSKHIVLDIEHTNQLLAQFMKEYNNTPHSSLKYQTPQEVFAAKQRSGEVWSVS